MGRPGLAWRNGDRIEFFQERADDSSLSAEIDPDPGSRLGEHALAIAADGALAAALTIHDSSESTVFSFLIPAGLFQLPRVIVAAQVTGATLSQPRVAISSDGLSLAIAWGERAHGVSDSDTLRLSVFASTGQLRGTFELTDGSSTAQIESLTALDDGNFVVFWSATPPNSPRRWFVQVVAGDGDLVSEATEISGPVVSATVAATAEGFVTLHHPAAGPAADFWIETHYDFTGAQRGTPDSFPYATCPARLTGSARGATDRRDYLCTQVRTTNPPNPQHGLIASRAFASSPAELAIVSCETPAGINCGRTLPVFAEPAAYTTDGAGDEVASNWALAWTDSEGVWVHRYTGADYIRFDRNRVRVRDGEHAELVVERTGSGVGEASVIWQTASLSFPALLDDFPRRSETLRWADGEVGSRAISIQTFDDGGSSEESFAVLLHSQTGNVLLGNPDDVVVTLTGVENPCASSTDHLCLQNGRFAVSALIDNPQNFSRVAAGARPLGDLAGVFWSTGPDNPELAVKVLRFGSTIKVFYAQLTDFPFELVITDQLTGRVRTYRNTPGGCGGIDQDFLASIPDPELETAGAAGKVSTCQPGELCLSGGRFAVGVTWRNPYSGSRGTGTGEALSDHAASFTFGDPRNLELVVKVLDFGDRVLFFSGAMSDFAYQIEIRDNLTGEVRRYENPAGRLCGVIDPDAF